MGPPTRTASGRPSSSSPSSRPSRASTTFKQLSDNRVFQMGQLSGTRGWLILTPGSARLTLGLAGLRNVPGLAGFGPRGSAWPSQVREKRSESDVAVIEDNGTQKIKIN